MTALERVRTWPQLQPGADVRAYLGELHRALTEESAERLCDINPMMLDTEGPTFDHLHLSLAGNAEFLNVTAASAGTGYLHSDIVNTGGRLRFGLESSAGGMLIMGGLAYAGVLGTYTNTPFQLFTNDTARVTILGGGYVGVGCTPSLTFDVGCDADALAAPASSGTTNTGIMRVGCYTRTWAGSELNIGIINSGDYPVWLQAQKPTDLSEYRALCLNPLGGSVLIGATAAVGGEKLRVYGDVYSDGDVLLASGKVIKINGTQIVGARVIDARISNIPNSGDAKTDGLIDAIRDAVLSHGLVAAA